MVGGSDTQLVASFAAALDAWGYSWPTPRSWFGPSSFFATYGVLAAPSPSDKLVEFGGGNCRYFGSTRWNEDSENRPSKKETESFNHPGSVVAKTYPAMCWPTMCDRPRFHSWNLMANGWSLKPSAWSSVSSCLSWRAGPLWSWVSKLHEGTALDYQRQHVGTPGWELHQFLLSSIWTWFFVAFIDFSSWWACI